MASNNKLLGSGVEPKELETKTEEKDFFQPFWIYSLEYPRGVIVRSEKQLKQLGDAWVKNIKDLEKLKEPKVDTAPKPKIDLSVKDEKSSAKKFADTLTKSKKDK